MKNIIEFYYNIRIHELHNTKDKFFFDFNNRHFIFEIFDGNINNVNEIYRLNYYLSNKCNIDRIILNRYNDPLTKINDKYYILLLCSNQNEERSNITLSLISNFSNIYVGNDIKLERNNWELLWENKIDYFESQVGQNEKKYPIIRESFDYFVGLGENAIAYLVNTKRELKPNMDDKKVISHNTLKEKFYDPTNIILDHKARDVAEYIKLSFFNKNYNIFKELDYYFYYNRYSEYGIRVLFARVLYPSFYFDIYDGIISEKLDEKKLNSIISRVSEYEIFLYKVYLYLSRYYDIPQIDWLKKRGINPHLQL